MEYPQTRTLEGIAGRWAVPLISGVGYFLLSTLTLHFTTTGGGVAPIWSANALLLAMILTSPRVLAPAIILAGMAGSALSALTVGAPPAPALLFSLANGLEVTIAVCGLLLRTNARGAFSDPKAVPEVLLWAGILAPAVSAWIGGAALWMLGGHALTVSYARWFLADSLGLLIFTPIFVAVLSGDLLRTLAGFGRRKRAEFGALIFLTAAMAGMIFFAAEIQLLFLVLAPMMLIALRTGWMGTKVALAIVTIIAGAAAVSGQGPIGLEDEKSVLRLYGIQIFIATMIIIQVPIAAALTARQSLIDRLRESEQSLRLLASRSPVLLLEFTLAGRCERAVGTSEPILDRPSTSLVGLTFADISEEGQYELRRAHEAALDDVTASHTAEYRTTKQRDAWLEVVFRAHFDERGRCTGTIATVHDVTTRKNQVLSLSRTAKTDSLTGLLNRAGFQERLGHALTHIAPGGLSIAVIDIDRFKLVNDNCGHQNGDAVLREVARRIASHVRASDAVGRLGGDEFVILLATSDWDRVQEICERIVSSVNADPVALPSGNDLHIAISCGVARYRSGLSADELIHDADTALYRAKRAGRNRVVAA